MPRSRRKDTPYYGCVKYFIGCIKPVIGLLSTDIGQGTPESVTMASMLTGEKLRAIRALRGISQAELAQKAGVSPTAIAEYERDKRDLRSGTIRKLCEALGVKVRYYVDDTEITGP